MNKIYKTNNDLLEQSEFFVKISKKDLIVTLLMSVIILAVCLYCASIIENNTIKFLVIISSFIFTFKQIRNEVIFLKRTTKRHEELIRALNPKEYLRMERKRKLKKLSK